MVDLDLIDDLHRLLDKEREAFLTGDLSGAVALLEEKEETVAALNASPPEDPDTLATLREKMTRNQTLAATALEGLRAVSQRLAALHEVRVSLDTYGADGKRHRVSAQPDNTMEKRA